MCLAVSGTILTIRDRPPEPVPVAGDAAGGRSTRPLDGGDELWRVAEVDFGGVRQQVSLACLPQARVGDRVLVHVGFALSVVEEDGLDGQA